MPIVFLSHASADEPLVDDLKTMLQSASGIAPDEIFYSSEKGTGIPSGTNFVDYIKTKMQESGFVIAVITPAYLESEFCLAELGAVWALAAKDFFPICVPAVDRSELAATLTGIQVERIDETGALAELLQRVSNHFGREQNVPAFDKSIRVFHATLDTKLAALRPGTKVPAERLAQADETTQAIAEQLASTQEQLSELRKRYDELKDAKTPEEVEALDIPDEETERVTYLLKEARYAVGRLKPLVRQVLPLHMRGDGFPWPVGQWERNDLQAEVDAGYLVDGDDGSVYLNRDWPEIATAIEAAWALQETFNGLTPEAADWFAREYAVPPDLRQTAAFKELLL